YVVKQREEELQTIITEEKLKPEDTRRFLENAFREGEVKTTGTEIDKLMPPASRFGSGGRAKKKQNVIEKLKVFGEKFFGIGGSITFVEQEPEVYNINVDTNLPMVGESLDALNQKQMT
ncbi:MAG: type I restriction endonuclease subunit R, partial [Cellulosilyticaceae bacterium]